MARLTQADLVDLNKTFEQRTPQELIRWVQTTFGDRAAAISAMQKAGAVICHMLSTMKVSMKVLFVDTGVLFPETLETRDRIAKEYGLEIVTLRPEKSFEEQTRELGVLYLTPEGQKQCCHLRKVEPLLKVADQYDALIGSLRRSEGGRRSVCPILAVDPEMNCLRVNPLVNFSDEQLEQYIREHNVIVNPLHDQGYPTIGCNRCTTPVLPNEPKRAGRWRHLGPWSQYCGINPTDVDQDTSLAIDLPQELIDRILGRETDFVI
ncbi:MAG: phosphoadenylyl-sulfate reductase [Planctomycetes bacterium]|nr:phosphoadenylyl-sulfate reductase [Planctomycetota bacterium]